MAEILTTAWWESRFARRLDFLFLVVVFIIVFRLAREEDLSSVGMILICIAIVVVSAYRWPSGALAVLIAMSAMPVFFVEVFGWKARPEHFGAIIISAAAAISFLFFGRKGKFDKLDLWILGYVAANFISSAFASSDSSSTLRWALQNSLAVLPYFVIRFLVQDLATLRKAFRIFLVIGLVEATYGILCYASHGFLGTTAGVSVAQYLFDVAAPYGSMFEPNLFGAYAGCFAVLFLAGYFFDGRRPRYLVCFLITSFAAVLSFSRAVLLALTITTVWLFWKGRRTEKGSRRTVPVLLLGAALIFLISFTAAGNVLTERFTNLYFEGLAEETTISRVLIIQEAIQDLPGHLLLGNGTASFNLSFDWSRYIPQWSSEKTWIGNAPLRILHDTGLLGLTMLLGFFIVIWRKIRRSWKKSSRPDSVSLGLVAGALLFGISFQSTDGTILAFFWVHLGFLATAAVFSGAVHEAFVESSVSRVVK